MPQQAPNSSSDENEPERNRLSRGENRRKKKKTKGDGERGGVCRRRSRREILFIVIIAFLILVILGLIIGMAVISSSKQGTEGKTSAQVSNQLTGCNEACLTGSGEIKDNPAKFERKGKVSKIYPPFADGDFFEVYCDCTEGEGKAWMVFQRRMDGTVDFFRNRIDYEIGFGDPSGEFWLGLDALHNFTADEPYELRVELGTSNETAYAEYETFQIGNASTFQLTLDGYNGTATDSFSIHNREKFLAKDDEKDDEGCANYNEGAWWFGLCFKVHLNGPWVDGPPKEDLVGIFWLGWKNDSLTRTEMKIRPQTSD